MSKQPPAPPSLDVLRKEIDAIDEQVHVLLMQRGSSNASRAAAEVAVGLAIIVAIFRRRRGGATADDIDLLRG